MKKIIRELIRDVLKIDSVGHTHLKRHQVYKVTTISETLIIKFYGVKNRYQNELTALQLLSKSKLPIPRIVDYGVYKDKEYIIMTCLEGETMNPLIMENGEQEKIFRVAGQYLRTINDTKHDLNYGRVGAEKFETFKAYFSYEVSRILSNLERFDHPYPEVIEEGIKTINKINVDSNEKKLCHMDFSTRNILLKDGRISGIIDFEHTIISDPNWDLAYADNKLQGKYREAFYEGYGYEPKDIGVFKLFHGLSICSWSLLVDREHYEEGIKLIEENL